VPCAGAVADEEVGDALLEEQEVKLRNEINETLTTRRANADILSFINSILSTVLASSSPDYAA